MKLAEQPADRRDIDCEIDKLINLKFDHAVSLGSTCYSSSVFKRLNLKRYSSPFDWMFTDVPMVAHCIQDDFQSFLNRDYYKEVGLNHGRMEYKHTYYNTHWHANFTHYDPMSDAGYEYMLRCIERFRSVLLSDDSKFFLFVAPINPRCEQFYIPFFENLYNVISAKTNNFHIAGVTTHKSEDEKICIDRVLSKDDGILYNYKARSHLTGIRFSDAEDDLEFNSFINNYINI